MASRATAVMASEPVSRRPTRSASQRPASSPASPETPAPSTMLTVTRPDWCRKLCAHRKTKLLAGPVITETAKARITTTARRRR